MTEVVGPTWSGRGSDDIYAGRYPLSVERHVLSQVDRLLPGVTTVTPHARYYTLHALVAAEAGRRRLSPDDTELLLRRVEVVFAAISSRHHDPHPGWSRAHGAEKITASLTSGLDVEALSQRRAYAQADTGFWGPYIASEILLRLIAITPEGRRSGEKLVEEAIYESLGDILALAARPTLSLSELDENSHLCLCGSRTAADGELLRRLLLAEAADTGTFDDHRRQTIRMLTRLIQIAEPANPSADIWPHLVYGSTATEDPALSTLDDTARWQGTAMRNVSVTAWRGLWAWLINDQIRDLTLIDDLASALADTMPDQAVRQFLDELPATADPGRILLPAEIDPAITGRDPGYRHLSILALGAQRSTTLPEPIRAEFEGPDDVRQELTPTWTRDYLTANADRSIRDVSRDLVRVLINRSQRIALRKARFDDAEGRFKIPTRVYLRDNSVWRASNEGGGGVSLRWGQLVTVMSGVDLYERRGDTWRLTELGEAHLG